MSSQSLSQLGKCSLQELGQQQFEGCISILFDEFVKVYLARNVSKLKYILEYAS
jgi:hypothetical protein